MTRKDAQMQMMYELEKLQQEMTATWLDKSVPDDWNGLDFWDSVDRRKTRVTLRLDEDMVRWFRKMGPGFGARMNKVLRIYYTGLQSGQVQAYPTDNTVPRLLLEAQDALEERGGR